VTVGFQSLGSGPCTFQGTGCWSLGTHEPSPIFTSLVKIIPKLGRFMAARVYHTIPLSDYHQIPGELALQENQHV